jgi:hypothetical protein
MQAATTGQTVNFTVAATGGLLTYQWFRNNTPIPGATNATLSLANVQPGDAGSYTVVITNALGSVTSTAGVVTVNASRLINLSTRGLVPAGGALTPGFVIRGTGSKEMVIRAVGPSLEAFGVGRTLSDPRLEIIGPGSTSALQANDNWGGGALLSGAFASVGAFPLPAASRDAAVLSSLPASSGGYTVRVTGVSSTASGIALAEVYDADSTASTARLVNVSTLGLAGTGEQALTPGFVISGGTPKQLLIRAIGPGLEPFGVPGLLADPQLQVIRAGQTAALASNDNWGGTAALRTAFGQAGAFTIADNSRDAAVVVTLPAGGYTVVVSGVGNTTGTALVEVYDLDP